MLRNIWNHHLEPHRMHGRHGTSYCDTPLLLHSLASALSTPDDPFQVKLEGMLETPPLERTLQVTGASMETCGCVQDLGLGSA